MKVKSENEVAQSCLTLRNPMDCSLPGSSIHRIFPSKSTGVGCHCLRVYFNYFPISCSSANYSHHAIHHIPSTYLLSGSVCLWWPLSNFPPLTPASGNHKSDLLCPWVWFFKKNLFKNSLLKFHHWDFPGSSVVKNMTCNTGDVGSIPGHGNKIPHTVDQLSHNQRAYATTRESVLHKEPACAEKISCTSTKT